MKGFFGDSATLIIVMFFFAVLFFVMAYLTSQLSATNDATINQYVNYSHQGFISFDTIAPLFVVGAGIALIVSALFIRSFPPLFAVMLIIQIVIILVSIPLANTWAGITTNIPSEAPNFGIWSVVFQGYPIVTTVLGIVFAVAIFMKGD